MWDPAADLRQVLGRQELAGHLGLPAPVQILQQHIHHLVVVTVGHSRSAQARREPRASSDIVAGLQEVTEAEAGRRGDEARVCRGTAHITAEQSSASLQLNTET